MKTAKPLSAISYNSDDFLKIILDNMIKAHKIQFYAFIRHKPEQDEKKSHIHLYFEPAKMIQTMDFEEDCKEIDTEKPDKPLKPFGIRSSKFDTWYLYAKHEKAYLAYIGENRIYHYSDDDFIVSDSDEFQFRINNIDKLALSPYAVMLESIEKGQTFPEFFRKNLMPPSQISAFKVAWDLLNQEVTYRGTRGETHENIDEGIVNITTGELSPNNEITKEYAQTKNFADKIIRSEKEDGTYLPNAYISDTVLDGYMQVARENYDKNFNKEDVQK